MQISLDDQVAWITGGNEGIGFETAKLAARCGAKVAISGRDEQALQEASVEIQKSGSEVLAIKADVTEVEEMRNAVQQIIDKWGKLNFVCANAGINGVWAPIEEIDPEEWAKTIAINLTGTYHTVHFAVPHLKQAGGGSIVIVSSVNGTRMFSNEGASAYASSKGGQLAFAKMLALELGPSKIRVNAVCPGAINTGIQEKTEEQDLEEIDQNVEFPEGNIPLTGHDMGNPEQVAQLIIFLASDAASHISGTPVWIDGAQSLLQG